MISPERGSFRNRGARAIGVRPLLAPIADQHLRRERNLYRLVLGGEFGSEEGEARHRVEVPSNLVEAQWRVKTRLPLSNINGTK
jgi:hypothetical protein